MEVREASTLYSGEDFQLGFEAEGSIEFYKIPELNKSGGLYWSIETTGQSSTGQSSTQ